jgi:hypothetical protein
MQNLGAICVDLDKLLFVEAQDYPLQNKKGVALHFSNGQTLWTPNPEALTALKNYATGFGPGGTITSTGST